MPIDSSENEFRDRRLEIVRSLGRANLLLIGILMLVIALAFAAAREVQRSATNASLANERAREVTTAKREAEQRLYESLIAQAQALRSGQQWGHAQGALEAVRAAARIKSTPQTRLEAIAALSLSGIGERMAWKEHLKWEPDPAFSGDLSLCAFFDHDGRDIIVERTPDWVEVARFPTPEDYIWQMAFSNDGRYLAARGYYGGVWVYDIEGRTEILYTRIGNRQGLGDVQFTSDGSIVAVMGDKPLIRFYAVPSGEEIRTLTTEVSGAIRFSPSDKLLAIGSQNRVRILEMETGEERHRLDGLPAHVSGMAWHPSGRAIALGLTDGEIRTWNLDNGSTQVATGHIGWVGPLAYSHRGDVLMSSAWDGTTRLWDSTALRHLQTIYDGEGIQFSTDDRSIAFGREALGFGIWQFDRSPVLYSLSDPTLNDGGSGLDVSADGRYVALGMNDSWHVWNWRDGRIVAQQDFMHASTMIFHPTEPWLIVSGFSGVFRYPLEFSESGKLSEIGEGERLIHDPPQLWERCSLAADGKTLAVVGNDVTVILNLGTLEILRRIEAPQSKGVEISPDARGVITATFKGEGMFVWNPRTGAMIRRLTDEGGMSYSLDGRWLATHTRTELCVWRLADFTRLYSHPWTADEQQGGAILFSPDMNMLVLGVRSIRLVRADSGKEFARLTPPTPMKTYRFAFGESSQYLAVSGPRNAYVWDLGALREALEKMGLDWEEQENDEVTEVAPLSGLADSQSVLPSPPAKLIPVVSAAAFVTIGLAVLSFCYHRRSLRSYLRMEKLAAKSVRDLQKAQAEAIHGQKLRALGTLAAGVAHDFNNLLSVIKMANGFLRRGVKDEPDLAEESAAIDRAVDQGGNIASSILGYSRESKFYDQSTNIYELIEDLLGMLTPQFLSGLELTVDLHPGLPEVAQSRNRLEQVLLNIVVNAAEAIDGKGTVGVTGRVLPWSERGYVALRPPEALSYVVISLADNGPGISGETIEHVFEPFFTTKNIGVQPGTGLGLSTVFSIASKDGLGVSVETTENQGATFLIWIPIETGDSPEATYLNSALQ